MQLTRQTVATIIALAFHISGFIAIGLFNSALFISLTPLNLIVCALLIFWTQEKVNTAFMLFCMVAFLLGFFTEVLGVNTGIIFGEYTYGTVLGPKWKGVPLLIGLQWVIVIYCSGVCMNMLQTRLIAKVGEDAVKIRSLWRTMSIVIDGALLAVVFDWILEPVAINLGYWTWNDGSVPWLNYITWWVVSAVILLFFQYLRFSKQNLFAVHLLMMQVMFFLLLRTVSGF